LGNVKSSEGRAALFNLIDAEDKQNINLENLKALAKEVGHVVSDDELKEIVSAMSKNPTITAEEFEKYLTKKLGVKG